MFIQLTDTESNEPIWINENYIETMVQDGSSTIIKIHQVPNLLVVKEDIETIRGLILF